MVAGVFRQQARPGESELEAVAATHAPCSLGRPLKFQPSTKASARVPAPRGPGPSPLGPRSLTGGGSPQVRGRRLCEQRACVTASPGWTADVDRETGRAPFPCTDPGLCGRQAVPSGLRAASPLAALRCPAVGLRRDRTAMTGSRCGPWDGIVSGS